MRRRGEDLAGDLERLIGAGVILRRGMAPDATYAFRHALIQDAAYATLLRRGGRALHRRALGMLSEWPGAEESGRLDLLGHHALGAEECQAAFGNLRRAGFEALDRFARREAASQFLRALRAGGRLTRDAETAAGIVDLHFALRNVLWALGRFAEMLEHLDEAEALCRDFPDTARKG